CRLRDPPEDLHDRPGCRRWPLQPARLHWREKEVIEGDPDPAHVSTSYVVRSNLSIRMQNLL
ncbi:MAG TPA: hypothetical protein VFE13_13745, partial [Caulobacteraceae bacterium]|nr:hypothetical protein [Caulobacteraceae bacterium]